MPKQLAKEYLNREEAIVASNLAQRCVQCGFCTATCPTFQITGNELDGPRGRISLIKGVLEGSTPTYVTQKHLDRCLLCRNCETTCPSGVQYGNLFSIGKKLVNEKVNRKKYDRILRWLLKEGLTSSLFSISMIISKKFRMILPKFLKSKIPRDSPILIKNKTSIKFVNEPKTINSKVLFLAGCVQPSMLPNINKSTLNLLRNCNFECIVAPSTCCGALKSHLDDKKGSMDQVKKNIDTWWPYVELSTIKYIIINASACSLEIKNYHKLFSKTSPYYLKAKKIVSLAVDLSEILPELLSLLKKKLPERKRSKLAFHPPCTLQHGQKINGIIENIFNELGYDVSVPTKDSNICCGSAGTYSVLQPKFANILRNNKLIELNKINAEIIISANIGCIAHLQSGTDKPVMHWVEVLAHELETHQKC